MAKTPSSAELSLAERSLVISHITLSIDGHVRTYVKDYVMGIKYISEDSHLVLGVNIVLHTAVCSSMGVNVKTLGNLNDYVN